MPYVQYIRVIGASEKCNNVYHNGVVAPTLPIHVNHPKLEMFIKTRKVDALTLICLLNLTSVPLSTQLTLAMDQTEKNCKILHNTAA